MLPVEERKYSGGSERDRTFEDEVQADGFHWKKYEQNKQKSLKLTRSSSELME